MSVLPDVLKPGLAIVFCGTAVGSVAARRGTYYSGPQNQFWPTLALVGLTPRELRPEEYPTVPKYGLGLTDLVKNFSGQDCDLEVLKSDRAELERKILTFQPRYLAFTSKRAAAEFHGRRVARVTYGLMTEQIGKTRLHVLTSPSAAARGSWSVEPWWELVRQCRV